MITSCTWHFTIDQDSVDVVVIKIKKCMVEVIQWMVRNMLKLNDDKTDV